MIPMAAGHLHLWPVNMYCCGEMAHNADRHPEDSLGNQARHQQVNHQRQMESEHVHLKKYKTIR